ncbi:MAG TPA: hypothetical protein VGO84_13885, partial [Burkholderiales bacterium]|nr:hypothetical protein [Burkholderiales bacterium]
DRHPVKIQLRVVYGRFVRLRIRFLPTPFTGPDRIGDNIVVTHADFFGSVRDFVAFVRGQRNEYVARFVVPETVYKRDQAHRHFARKVRHKPAVPANPIAVCGQRDSIVHPRACDGDLCELGLRSHRELHVEFGSRQATNKATPFGKKFDRVAYRRSFDTVARLRSDKWPSRFAMPAAHVP